MTSTYTAAPRMTIADLRARLAVRRIVGAVGTVALLAAAAPVADTAEDAAVAAYLTRRAVGLMLAAAAAHDAAMARLDAALSGPDRPFSPEDT